MPWSLACDGYIRRTYNASVDENRKLKDDWPGMENTELLVEKAIPLFIFASTVCHFISQRNCANPQKQLQKVLTYETKSQESKMNAIYLPPLEQQLEDLSLRKQDKVFDEFQQVVSTIILLKTPLSMSALAQLINTTEETIYRRLDMIHSFLKISRTLTSPIRLLHLLFRDFLLDLEKGGTNKFWVDEKQTHDRIAEACLRVMNSCLKEDICNLIIPGSKRSEVSPECMASCIPIKLYVFSKHEKVLSFLKRHLLHYIEVMSLVGRFVEISRVVMILQNLAKDGPHEMLKELLRDTHRFILIHSTVINQYSLQLYSSLLYSVPTNNILSAIFIAELPDPESAWGQRQLVLEDDKSWKVESITMDDSRLAYLFSDGTIRIWLLDTGERIRESSSEIGQRLEGQEGEITLCRNLTIITCNDKDKGGQLSLRHADTGDVVERYDLPPGYSKSVQISQNSQYIAFVGSDNTPVLLHIDATDCPRHIYLHNSTAVAFISGDSGRYAVWNLETCDFIRQRHRSNRCIQDMIWCDSSLLTSVSFSLTQKSWVILAYSDEDGRNMATLEWLHSGKLICHLQTENDSIQEIYFSPDNTTLALVSWNGAVEARKIATEECLAISEVEGDYDLTTLSPTFDLVASVEKDHTTIVRRNDLHESEEEDHPIYLLALSPDQRHIASASYGNVPCLWDVLTSDGIHELYPVTVPDRFVGWTNSFQFSPNSGHFCVHKGGFVSNVLLEIWYVKTGQHVRNIRDENSWCEDNNMRTELQGTISPDGRWIFTIREHGLSLWVLDELSSPRELAFQGTVCDVMFSPDSLLYGYPTRVVIRRIH
ncbi:unnamed protein product [Fusarium venenatum]|uniref:NACHT domain-containing protein n=1 Tax=Fusarium venenatum TaxID=56646 RepID=A0A2L2T1X8_9HYPO|nr:uncharacterized protein FVRRES_07875 [Fusarium venenatum]CEI63439.1 unnamed protein product [Fusarium venenatum]